MVVRCDWSGADAGMIEYHDQDWGVPIHDDNKLFEMLSLEGAQAGLSWSTILKRRQGYYAAFDGFDIEKISRYRESKVKHLLQDIRIVRNQAKIRSVINNAKKAIEIKKEFRSFDRYMWGFVGNNPVVHKFKSMSQIPVTTELSDKMTIDLKKRGFTFVGSTIGYAFMQSVGMVNDHTTNCFRYKAIMKL